MSELRYGDLYDHISPHGGDEFEQCSLGYSGVGFVVLSLILFPLGRISRFCRFFRFRSSRFAVRRPCRVRGCCWRSFYCHISPLKGSEVKQCSLGYSGGYLFVLLLIIRLGRSVLGPVRSDFEAGLLWVGFYFHISPLTGP